MSKCLVPVLVAVVAIGACGGDDDESVDDTSDLASSDGGASTDGDSADEDSADGGNDRDASGGAIADPAPTGQATASIDGQDISFVTDTGGGCSISDESISFGFAAADGVTTIGGGMNRSDGGWMGSILIRVPDPDGDGMIQYDPAPVDGNVLQDGSVVVDGSSMSYSGPIRMQPPNDGSNPPPVEVGDGTILATC